MITLYPLKQLGHADHGWLQARHHFSFGQYWNPARIGFGTLRVINDDTVAAGKGFATHPHDNMEIITYVRSGAITHKDSMGNVGRTEAGDVQVMSAGTGVFHSEYNLEREETRLYQIWIIPAVRNVTPRWETKAFPKSPVRDALHPLASGQKQHADSGALLIYQDAAIYGGTLTQGTELSQSLRHQGYVLVSSGSIILDDMVLHAGDGAEITDLSTVRIHALSDAEVLVIDAPPT